LDKVARIIKLIIIIAVAVTAAVLLWMKLSGLLCTLVISVIAAYLLNKPLKYLEKKMRRPWALLIIFGLLAGATAFILYYFVPLFLKQAADLVAYIPKVIQSAGVMLGNFGDSAGEPLAGILNQAFQGFDRRAADWLGGATITAAQSISLGLGWTLLFPFFMFYFLKDHEQFIDQICYLVPIRFRADMHYLYLSIDKAIGLFIRGQLLVSATVAVLVTAGLLVVGVPNALLLGLICGLCNIIPYIGPFIGVVPVALVSAVLGWRTMLLAVLVVFAVQQLDNMVISPKIIGDSIRMHPAYIIIAIIAGSSLFGIIGLLFALPALIILKEIALFLFKKRLYRKKDAPAEGQ
jgi:predicted PurR-regulated permease PerM